MGGRSRRRRGPHPDPRGRRPPRRAAPRPADRRRLPLRHALDVGGHDGTPRRGLRRRQPRRRHAIVGVGRTPRRHARGRTRPGDLTRTVSTQPDAAPDGVSARQSARRRERSSPSGRSTQARDSSDATRELIADVPCAPQATTSGHGTCPPLGLDRQATIDPPSSPCKAPRVQPSCSGAPSAIVSNPGPSNPTTSVGEQQLAGHDSGLLDTACHRAAPAHRSLPTPRRARPRAARRAEFAATRPAGRSRGRTPRARSSSALRVSRRPARPTGHRSALRARRHAGGGPHGHGPRHARLARSAHARPVPRHAMLGDEAEPQEPARAPSARENSSAHDRSVAAASADSGALPQVPSRSSTSSRSSSSSRVVAADPGREVVVLEALHDRPARPVAADGEAELQSFGDVVLPATDHGERVPVVAGRFEVDAVHRVDRRVGRGRRRGRPPLLDDRSTALLHDLDEVPLQPLRVGDHLWDRTATDPSVREVRELRRRVVAPDPDVGHLGRRGQASRLAIWPLARFSSRRSSRRSSFAGDRGPTCRR